MREGGRSNKMYDQQHVDKLLAKVDIENKFYIDIGCSFNPNTPLGLVKDSDISIFCEYDLSKVERGGYKQWVSRDNFNLVTEKITPENVVEIFSKITDRKDPKFLDLDIDGYDFYVLEALLKGGYRPSLIMAETNEKIPPPIKFSVKYHPDYQWDGSHMFGMSLAKADELFQEYEYDIVGLAFNNVYAVPKEDSGKFDTYSYEEAYDRFYRNANWEFHFSHNLNVGRALYMSPEDAIKFFVDFFAEYEGKYDIGL